MLFLRETSNYFSFFSNSKVTENSFTKTIRYGCIANQRIINQLIEQNQKQTNGRFIGLGINCTISGPHGKGNCAILFKNRDKWRWSEGMQKMMRLRMYADTRLKWRGIRREPIRMFECK